MQWDNFDMIQHSIQDFFDMMECHQLANQLDPPPKQNQSKLIPMTLISQWKSQMKKCKAKMKKNDSNLLAPKKVGMLDGPSSSHMSDEC
jgi:superfamily II RNA helicase